MVRNSAHRSRRTTWACSAISRTPGRASPSQQPQTILAPRDLQADALWNSFPVDVDSLLPSGESSGMYDDMPGSSGRFDSGMAAGRPGVNNNAGPNGAEMFVPARFHRSTCTTATVTSTIVVR